MVRSNYLHGILFLGAVFVCRGAGSFTVGREYQVSGIKYRDEYQVSGIKYQDLGMVTENGGAFKQNEGARKRELVKQIYTSQIGIRERPSNSGPDVEKYLRYVNLPKGNPWCAAFVCWVFGQAGVPNPRTGWSPGLFPIQKLIWQRGERGKVKGENRSDVPYASPSSLVTRNPQLVTPGPGDVFGIYFPEKQRIAHTGFIDQWDGTWLITVEGNTNDSGRREGDGVYRKRRLVRSICRVARYIN